MDQVDQNSRRRKGLWATLAIAAVSSASAITIALPAAANADPEPTPSTPASPTAAPPATPPTTEGQPPPTDTNPVDPNAGRIDNPVGGFSFVLPAGWVESDASHLDYGSALLSKTTGQPPAPGQPAPVANDTRIVLGRLDQKLYASAEATNAKAAVRLGSDMGEFFMPYPGTRINQETVPLNANGVTGSASYYEVKFADPSKPNGQIWTGVIGSPSANAAPPQRWFVVWLGTANDPVDKNAAKALTESIRSLTPAAAPATTPATPTPASPAPASPTPASPAPGAVAPAEPAPAAPAPGAPPAESPTPAPAAPASPSQAPAQAPAGEVAPTPTPAQRTLPA